MGIYVKGMTMPSECRECDLTRYYSVSGNTKCIPAGKLLAENYKPLPYDSRPEWCPLVEVKTPHGDLIDKDEFLKQMNVAIAMMSGTMKAMGFENDEGMQMELKAYRDIRDGIKDYDTVIDAEGEG